MYFKLTGDIWKAECSTDTTMLNCNKYKTSNYASIKQNTYPSQDPYCYHIQPQTHDENPKLLHQPQETALQNRELAED